KPVNISRSECPIHPLILFNFTFRTLNIDMAKKVTYNEDNIKSLDWKQHIRLRPGMYIGKTGDGAAHDDGIYILIKEIIDNSIDEFVMGNGNEIHINITERE